MIIILSYREAMQLIASELLNEADSYHIFNVVVLLSVRSHVKIKRMQVALLAVISSTDSTRHDS